MRWIVPVGCIGFGMLAGVVATSSPLPAPRATATTQVTSCADDSQRNARLERRLDDVLAQLEGLRATPATLPPSPAAAWADPAAPVDAEPSGDAPAAVAAAQEIVDDAVGRGAWSRADTQRLTAAVSVMGREEGERLLASVHAASNAGLLQVASPYDLP